MNQTKLIIGLGNPGNQYLNTRHNVGFKILDIVAKNMNISFEKMLFQGVYGTKIIQNTKVIFAKPQTFMNLSGQFIQKFCTFYKIDINEILIIYDDVDLSLGTMRFTNKGSSGGHNGIKSIIQHLNSEQFCRLKIGIGPKQFHLANFVLNNFDAVEQKKIENLIPKITKIINLFLNNKSLNEIMQLSNTKDLFL